ncbi:hypothetical protein ACH49M_21215 [Rhodococcus qingshengii]|uniref:hypothetical protein n=1 Tax=Rhodococcus erythropolis group TaxID=2840174 RepID=UPI002225CAA2|nr:hypothetical protein [Rhodococcus erythropolis]MCW2300756.1 hypothetical protein [Rhodococcus erythropolis]
MALISRITTLDVNLVHQTFLYFDSTVNRRQLFGSSALLKNDSEGVIYVTDQDNEQMPVAHCLVLNPGDSVTIPLSGQTGGSSDDQISAGSFHPDVDLSISYLYSI